MKSVRKTRAAVAGVVATSLLALTAFLAFETADARRVAAQGQDQQPPQEQPRQEEPQEQPPQEDQAPSEQAPEEPPRQDQAPTEAPGATEAPEATEAPGATEGPGATEQPSFPTEPGEEGAVEETGAVSEPSTSTTPPSGVTTGYADPWYNKPYYPWYNPGYSKPKKPTMPPYEAKLPYTGGDPLGFWGWGAALAALGALTLFGLRKTAWGMRFAKTTMGVGVGLVAVGVGLAAYPSVTDARYALNQRALAAEARPTDTGGQTMPEGMVARIVIPKVRIDAFAAEGTSQNVLNRALGHYPGTPLPGEDGNAAIAGHRTMWGKAFGRLGELKPGDQIVTYTEKRRATYRVASLKVVDPGNFGVVSPTDDNRLTLTTCHPPGSAAKRLIVTAMRTD